MTTRHNVRKLLAEIEPGLVRTFPLAARAAQVAEPVYALIHCYIDSTTDECTPFVVVVPERVRQRALERKGADASWLIWSPHQQLGGSAGLIRQQSLHDVSLQAKINACYKLLARGKASDDNVLLKPFREMMWRVAHALNERDWRGILDTTDDFAVVASDWSGFWVKEDATKSLPLKKRRLLESRRLFFQEETEEEQAEFQRQFDAAEATLSSRTERQRIAFWIRQLDLLSAGKPCLLTKRRWNESVALGRLEAIGGAASLPLLDLAVRLDAMPEETDGQESTASEVLAAVFSTVGDIGRADSTVETRLRAMLAAACKANRGRPRWSRTPFLCAHCLSELFDGYPWPSTDHANVLMDAEEYLSAPLRAKPSL
jgi:hypothetical protein